jgi:hypothetical protein
MAMAVTARSSHSSLFTGLGRAEDGAVERRLTISSIEVELEGAIVVNTKN